MLCRQPTHPPQKQLFSKKKLTRRVSSHSKDGGFEVLLVTSEIDESDDFRGLLADSNPVQVAVVRLVDHLASGVETQNIVANRATINSRKVRNGIRPM